MAVACGSTAEKAAPPSSDVDGSVSAPTTTDPGLDTDAGGGGDARVDEAGAVDAPIDVLPLPDVADAGDADVDAGAMVRVTGHVDFNGAVVGADVQLLSPRLDSTTTDQDGDFIFYVPEGSQAIFKVTASGAYPMIRGVVAGQTNRIRVFYLAGTSEQQAAQSLGKTFDPSKGIVEVDFRNASIGGYGVTITATTGGATVSPGYGIALDGTSTPQLSTTTLTGGDGSTLLLGDVPANASVSFTPSVPADAGADASVACKPCDAVALPIEPNVVTWFDMECGSANCE